MKRTLTLLSFALLISMAGCQESGEKTTTDGTEKTADLDVAKSEINTFIDSFHTALKQKNAEEIKKSLNINGVYCGTDPQEVFSQQSFVNYIQETFNSPSIGTIEYKIDRREIQFNEDATAVTIMDQFNMDVISQNTPWRMVSHAVKKDNVWKFDFISFSLTIPHENLSELNAISLQ